MRFYIAIFDLCFAAAIMAGSPYPDSTAQQKGKSAQAAQPGFVSVTQKPDSGCGDTAKADNNPPKWYAPLERPEWLTLIIAVLALIVIGWQSWETRKSADAAKSSAEALVNSERPWLNTSVRQDASSFGHQFSINNLGRTPAMVFGVLTCRTVASELPEEPEYPSEAEASAVYNSPEASQKMRLLAPNESWDFYKLDLSQHSKQFTELQRRDISSGERKLFFFGKVKYRDVLKPDVIHETLFCYLYDGANFALSEPPAYNGYT